jgi:hypothetical protein
MSRRVRYTNSYGNLGRTRDSSKGRTNGRVCDGSRGLALYPTPGMTARACRSSMALSLRWPPHASRGLVTRPSLHHVLPLSMVTGARLITVARLFSTGWALCETIRCSFVPCLPLASPDWRLAVGVDGYGLRDGVGGPVGRGEGLDGCPLVAHHSGRGSSLRPLGVPCRARCRPTGLATRRFGW